MNTVRSALRRRFLIAVAACPTVAWPGLVAPQAKKPPVLIGWLHGSSRSASGLAAFKEAFATLGWKEGLNYTFEERWADGQVSRLSTLAEQLAAKKPAVIVAGLSAAVVAAAKAAPNVPVVQTTGQSPVNSGLAASLARPGGMVTGVTNIVTEVSDKYLELLLAAVPKLRRVGFLVDLAGTGNATYIKNARRAAERYGVDVRFAEVRKAEDLEPAIAGLTKDGTEGLVVLPSSGLFQAERRRILTFALTRRWPVVAGPSVFADDGALLSYSPDSSALIRRAAYYVDRILKGAKPGDLPIEQPTKFELVVNMNTARALGLSIPQELLLRADKVIE